MLNNYSMEKDKQTDSVLHPDIEIGISKENLLLMNLRDIWQ
jgi:hypothetical protein